MDSTNSPHIHVYELPLDKGVSFSKERSPKKIFTSLPTTFLINNILWYCRIRWIIIISFVILGTLGFSPETFYPYGLKLNAEWPFLLAGILVMENLLFLWHTRTLKLSPTIQEVKLNLWSQIFLDLIIATTVVHCVGSLETYVPFIYLFHIVLGCIFFSQRQSFIIVVAACVLYAGCVSMELFCGSFTCIFTGKAMRVQIDNSYILNMGFAMAIWLVVWGLTSRLSGMLRDQSNELAETNRLLMKTHEEKTKSLLRTTHELKAPFAAIQVNTQLLLKGICGPLPDKALEIIRRIAERSHWLTYEIQEMLQLSALLSTSQITLHWSKFNLSEILSWCVDNIESIANEHNVTFRTDMEPAFIMGVEDHLKMLLVNLLSNAVIYSKKGGHVHLQCGTTDQNRQKVTIEDHGIGIPGDKLPMIFDDYYRTNEALRHNKMSTGLGLSIVRHIASIHGIRVRVESQVRSGTKFELWFPSHRTISEKTD